MYVHWKASGMRPSDLVLYDHQGQCLHKSTSLSSPLCPKVSRTRSRRSPHFHRLCQLRQADRSWSDLVFRPSTSTNSFHFPSPLLSVALSLQASRLPVSPSILLFALLIQMCSSASERYRTEVEPCPRLRNMLCTWISTTAICPNSLDLGWRPLLEL